MFGARTVQCWDIFYFASVFFIENISAGIYWVLGLKESKGFIIDIILVKVTSRIRIA